ncbi:alkylation response protein AidB-like acyl-CoA dehydrogenase [Blastococcus colisei]|uniref:Alkylation response protein AidB-like acyl-CoA dehydrogenase n=1 Tax=Blastococcus colisei TaxID=1564162 RepID=A0A543PGQ8_9ACTN|nr:acyl-CoA dehydrogenase family protein [Blastococcus colisei]TQN43259.1 alkylation response protein AidB-like acyl-CoA dehydrogenase [Blastococcus colisei]
MTAPPVSVADAAARAGDVATGVAGPLTARTDSGVWPAEAVRALQVAGLAGLSAPRPLGGAGLGLRGVAAVCEVLGRTCASTALCYGMHCVATAVIAARPTERQRTEFLDAIVAGEHLSTLALSEPGTGAQFWLPQTRLTRTDAGLRIDGEKSFVTNGSQADSYVLSTVAADPEAPAGQFSCVLVPKEAAGLTWGAEWSGIGMRGNSSRGMRLEDVRLGPGHLLGAEGDQIWYVFEVVAPYFLMAMAGTYLGVAQASLDEATAHLSRRAHAHTGRRLASEPVLQHRLGELWAQVERTRRLVYWAAEEADGGGPSGLPGLTSAKAEVARCAVEVTNEAMTLVGGIGYRDRSPLERHLRDARAADVMSPTTDILRTWTGRAALGLPLLGE